MLKMDFGDGQQVVAPYMVVVVERVAEAVAVAVSVALLALVHLVKTPFFEAQTWLLLPLPLFY